MIKATYKPGIPGPSIFSEAAIPAEFGFDVDAFSRGLHAVAERYGVSARDLITNDLAYKMALAREPELQLDFGNKPKTKPTVWTLGKLWRLWLDVETVLHQNPGKSTGWAVERVKKLSHWDGMSVTRERYYDARRHPFGEMSKKMVDLLDFEKVAAILGDMDWGALP
ncbi:MAG: hypothetical protein U1C47_02280 [Hydrogenophaga sp.]|nr:hypothetical protein [Hydrogenophaga sp.]